ncbi:ABC transporter ATP-binding protein [Nonomuraea turkmeniaca]|uniref:ABC transporter ATP-binding protein n=2 Tax=Nonomuraea turkmeniaca TaxID=103838 RepID=A0A5S4FPF9_9ACTN|nr:ABC transporter ATP-binding protein [Nonomuraea turkmeniaca]
MTAGKANQVAAIVLLALLSTITTLALPLIGGAFVAELEKGGGAVTSTALWMVAVGLAAAITGTLSGYLLSKLGIDLVTKLRVRTLRHSLGLPLKIARREGTGDLAARLTSDSSQVRGLTEVGPLQLPMAALQVVATLVIMGFLDGILLLMTVGSFLIAIVGVAFVVKAIRKKFEALQAGVGKLSDDFVATLESLTVVKAHRAESRLVRSFSERAENLGGLEIAAARLEAMVVPVMTLAQQVALVVVIMGGGVRYVAGEISLPNLVSFLLLLLQLAAPLVMAIQAIGAIQAGLVAKQRFESVFSLPYEQVDDRAEDGEPVTVEPGTPAVVLHEVGFAYEAGQPVLDDVGFTVPPSGLTAMVGRSGAGKTTVLGLIERFMELDSGKISVFGREVADWPLSELRGRIAYVDQSFTLLRDTVRNNLLLGLDESVPDEVLLHALEQVGLREEIAALPQGLDTRIGGENDLSGGQRQRLALAGVLLSDARLVLLDEPSSQLDSLNEGRLREVVDRLAEDRAVLVVAHRLSTVQHARHVILLDRGKVLAQGTHERLMSECEPYADLVRGQMIRPVDSVPAS